MKNLQDLCYGIVGLGLMGGSLGKAIRQNILVKGSKGKILGSDINASSLSLAKEQNICDDTFSIEQVDSMLAECDFVYICLYPHATLKFLNDHKTYFRNDSIITDISGVKSFMQAEISSFNSVLQEKNVDFILGHPMAGGEKEGYSNSLGTIFNNHNYILVPQEYNKKENIELFKNLIYKLGFTHIVETSSLQHDHKIAFTSQLCHVIASALVNSAEDCNITEFGGGSFEDLTRIAMINAPLWTELFLSNKSELLNHIDSFEKSLSSIKQLIKNDDAEALTSYLTDVRIKRISMNSNKSEKSVF